MNSAPCSREPAAVAAATDAALYGAIFAGSALAFCVGKLWGGRFGAASDLLAILGDATCGWSWLLVRALFRRRGEGRGWWPPALVLAMVGIGATLRLAGGHPGPMLRMADNAEGLVSSALLLIATIEPLRGVGEATSLSEKRFRFGFAAGYAAVVAFAVLFVDGAPAGSAAARFGGALKATCALTALAGMSFAIWYRSGHPIPQRAPTKRRTQAGSDTGLANRILRTIRAEDAYAKPDLKVADLARRVGEAEYKVTQCITGALGFRNFNHMANHFRVEEAKRRLADPAFDRLPVLTIALDYGFGSIGPFNRAFKEETGLTPMQFRKAGAVAQRRDAALAA